MPLQFCNALIIPSAQQKNDFLFLHRLTAFLFYYTCSGPKSHGIWEIF